MKSNARMQVLRTFWLACNALGLHGIWLISLNIGLAGGSEGLHANGICLLSLLTRSMRFDSSFSVGNSKIRGFLCRLIGGFRLRIRKKFLRSSEDLLILSGNFVISRIDLGCRATPGLGEGLCSWKRGL